MRLTKRLVLMARGHWGLLGIAVAGVIGAALLNLITPEIVRRLTASLLEPGGIDERSLGVLCVILAAAYLLRAVCRFIGLSISHVAAWRFVGKLTLTVYDKLQSLSMRYFQDKQTGQLMSRMINDTRQAEILIAHALPDLISNAMIIIGVAVMLFIINPALAALTMIPVPFVVWAGTYFSKKVAPMFRINQQVLGELNGVVQDNLSGMREIQAFGQEPREHAKLDGYRKLYEDVNIRANFANGAFHPGIELLTSMGTIIVVGIGGLFALRGGMHVPDIVGFLMYLSLFYQPLAALARLVEDVQVSYAGAVRVFEVLDEEPEITDSPTAAKLTNCRGKLAFKNVSFSYSDGEPVLRDISFTADTGEMIALVGATGVGKTTIASLITRFYDPVEGSVEVDGLDIKNLMLSGLRSNISMVLQDVFLFNSTVAENIAYGVENASQEQIEQAAKIAQAHGFITEMPDGYNTLIGERGVRLSGGQKQRIAIARAVLRDTPILILDEATSAVDNETEAEIQAAIERLAGSRTIIVIAHRLSTIMRADQILVLEDGKVVQQGTYAQLLEADGPFSKLAAKAK
ncbi:MAG: ABC transporter ATP-binding protein/permease [Oscillospiraceae bacterium]|nr:ABC transporter ATP-binding protein/permease [Oscillospiraceae bacterium]